MTSKHKIPDNRRPSRHAMIFGWIASAAVCDPNRAIAAGCSLLDRAAWAAFELVRLAVLVGHWQTTPFLSEGSRILDILLQVGPCLWCLLHLAAGRA
jgi:hypothetical protein